MNDKGMIRLLKPDGEKSNTSKTIALSLASVLSSILSLLLSMVMTRVLTKTDLAAYNQTMMVFTTVNPFLLLGIPSGIYYVLTRNEHRERAIINEAMLCVLCSSVVFAVFLICGGNELLARLFKNEDISGYLLYLIPYALFSLIISVAQPVLVYRDRVSFSAKFNVTKSIFSLSLVILALLVFRTAIRAIQFNVAADVLFGILALWIIYRYIAPHNSGKIEIASIKKLLIISVPLGLASMAGTLDSYMDKWIVSVMCSPEEYAVFVNGAHEIPFIGAITGAITTVILVDMTKACRDGRNEDALELFQSAAKKTSMILLPIMMIFLVLAEPIIVFLFTDDYVGAANILRVYALFLPMRTVFYGSIMTALGKSNSVLVRAVLALAANAVLSVLLVKVCGPIGASFATIIAAYCVNLPINFYVICKELHIKWTQLLPFRHYGVCLLLSLPGAAVCLLTSMLTKNLGAFWQLAFSGTAFVVLTVPIFIKKFNLPWREIIGKIKSKFAH